MKYNYFNSDYKSLIEYNYKLILILILIYIFKWLSLIFYHLYLSRNSRIHDIISILHLKKFKDFNENKLGEANFIVFKELNQFYINECLQLFGQEKINGENLSHILAYQAMQMLTCFENNIKSAKLV